MHKERKPKPSWSPDGDRDGVFDAFWEAYPRKVAKGAARRAWSRVKAQPDTLGLIVAALQWQIRSSEWTRDNGQYIPHPATYLNQRRWEDARPGRIDDGLAADGSILPPFRTE